MAQQEPRSILDPPSLEHLNQLEFVPVSNSVANPDQLNAIAAAWVALGVPDAQVPKFAWDLARHCADIGSSPSVLPVGTAPGSTVSRASLAGAVRSICTLRQFCMFFAKVVWNLLISSNTPPANWHRFEVTEPQRFAAFDFFDGVTSPAALNPVGGLIRPPSHLELAASSTAKFIGIARASRGQSNLLTNAPEVTHGRSADTRVELLEAP